VDGRPLLPEGAFRFATRAGSALVALAVLWLVVREPWAAGFRAAGNLLASVCGAAGRVELIPNPAEPEPRGLPGLQAPDPGLQVKQFLEPGVWSLESLPSCARLRHEGTRPLGGERAARWETEDTAIRIFDSKGTGGISLATSSLRLSYAPFGVFLCLTFASSAARQRMGGEGSSWGSRALQPSSSERAW
jgi:hypothetical protein